MLNIQELEQQILASRKKGHRFKLNSQGLARADKGLMSCLLPDEGKTIISVDGCFDHVTEILTKRGWLKFTDIVADDEVWQVDPNTFQGSWVKPIRVLSAYYHGPMVYIKNNRISMALTTNHRVLYAGQHHNTRQDKKRKRWVQTADQHFPSKVCAIPTTSYGVYGEYYTEKDIWLAAMTQADGS